MGIDFRNSNLHPKVRFLMYVLGIHKEGEEGVVKF